MRLFVALELPPGARAEALARAASLRSRLPAARWLPPASLHLTLVFLGDTEPAAVEPLATALGEVAARHPPCDLQLAGGGSFPAGRPRVVWVGFSRCEALVRLQVGVARAVAQSLDRPPERRRFHPHLTLARCRRPWPPSAAERWRQGLDGPLGPPFVADAVALIRSHLEPAGARYETVARLPLTAARAAGV